MLRFTFVPAPVLREDGALFLLDTHTAKIPHRLARMRALLYTRCYISAPRHSCPPTAGAPRVGATAMTGRESSEAKGPRE